jgi:hypothetical protein
MEVIVGVDIFGREIDGQAAEAGDAAHQRVDDRLY